MKTRLKGNGSTDHNHMIQCVHKYACNVYTTILRCYYHYHVRFVITLIHIYWYLRLDPAYKMMISDVERKINAKDVGIGPCLQGTREEAINHNAGGRRIVLQALLKASLRGESAILPEMVEDVSSKKAACTMRSDVGARSTYTIEIIYIDTHRHILTYIYICMYTRYAPHMKKERGSSTSLHKTGSKNCFRSWLELLVVRLRIVVAPH